MGIEQAFLDDIIANPDDDTPRLIYADWFDDHGQSERAEFIRLQCRLARLKPGDPNARKLAQREAELLEEFGLDWAEPFRGLASEVQLRRGFVEAIEVSSQPDQADRIRRAMELAPVRALRLCYEEEDLPARAGPCLARLRELYLMPTLEQGTSGLDKLFEPGGFTGLTSLLLDCEDTTTTPADIEGLLQPGALPPLNELGLFCNNDLLGEDEAILGSLIDARHLVNLHSFHLVSFVVDLIDELLACPVFSSLTRLNLRMGLSNVENWRQLLWSPQLRNLEWLDLTDADLVSPDEQIPLRGTPFGQEVAERYPGVVIFDGPDDQPMPRWSGLTF